jgi:hypothetical protein
MFRFDPDLPELVKNHRPRHSVTYPTHLKCDGYVYEMDPRYLEAPLAKRSNGGLVENVVPSAFLYLHCRNGAIRTNLTAENALSGPTPPAGYVRVCRVRRVFCHT